MPEPRLGPGPCSALGAHKHTSICAQGCWETHQRVTAQWKAHLGALQHKPKHSKQDETPGARVTQTAKTALAPKQV